MRKIHEKIITFFEKCIDKTGKMGYIISVAVSTLVLQVLKIDRKV